MHDLSYLHDKKFALIMVEDDESPEGDWVVLSGTAKWRDGECLSIAGWTFQSFRCQSQRFTALSRCPQT